MNDITSKINSTYDLAEIYSKEKMMLKLIELLKKSKNLHLVEEFFNKLYDRYPNEIADIYEDGIMVQMKNPAGRTVYKEISKYLERIVFLKLSDRASKIIDNLKNQYPSRRAMIEELDKTKLK